MSESSSSPPPKESVGRAGADPAAPPCTPEELGGLHLFRQLEADELERWSSTARTKTVPENTYVYREGEPCEAVYALVSGTATAFREAVGLPVQMLRRIGHGQLFGLVDAFADRPHGSSVRASSDSRVLELPLDDFERFLEEHPDLLAQLEAEVTDAYAARLGSALELEKHKEVRMRVAHRVEVDTGNGERFTATLENLSVGGVCLRGAPETWQENDEVFFRLHLPGGPLGLEGRVAWRDGDSCGIAFHRRSARHDTLVQMAIHLLLETLD